MPQDRDEAPTNAADGRSTWRRLTAMGAAVGAVVTLVVAVGAWVQPDVRGWFCDATDRRAIGCNEVPDAFLGEWTGTETCHDIPLVTACVDRETQLTLTIGRGRVNQDTVVTSRSELCESFWTLTSAEATVLEFRTERSRPTKPGPADSAGPSGAPTGCPTGLVVTVRVDPDGDTIQTQTRSGSGTGPYVPAGIVIFTADLRRV